MDMFGSLFNAGKVSTRQLTYNFLYFLCKGVIIVGLFIVWNDTFTGFICAGVGILGIIIVRMHSEAIRMKYEKITEEEEELTQKIENNEIVNMLCNKDIPSQLISSYDTIEKSGLRLQQNTPLGQARTRYIRTTAKTSGKRSEIRTTNDALFIEHSFGNQESTHSTDAYVIISPDRRDNPMAKLGAILIGPFFILYLFGDNLDSFSKLFTRFNINPYIAIGFIMVVIGYIGYIINNKINMQRAIILENRAFEQEFDVDSNDPIIARQICNPVMITDIASWLKNNHLSKYVSIYFDLSTNRIIYKFDFLKHEIGEIHEMYTKECINITTTMIQKIDLLKYINLVYAGILLSHKTENTQSTTPIQTC